jgi:parvulin-like peptidyl-prolyl isomerase
MRKFFARRLWYYLIAGIFGLSIVAYFSGSPTGGGAGGADRTAAQDVLVLVNGEPITRREKEELVRQLSGLGARGSLSEAMLSGMVLARSPYGPGLIDQALARSIAKTHGIIVTDADVEKVIAEYKQRMGEKGRPLSDAELEERLAREGRSVEELREDIRRRLVVDLFLDSLAQKQNITEEDLLKSYDEIKVRHILVAVDTSPRPTPNARPDAQARRRAEEILAKIKNGADFAKMADEYSDDPSNKSFPQIDSKTGKSTPKGRGKGGDLGWYKRGGGFAKEFEEAAFALKPGQVSEIVKTPFGYHIIRVDEVRRNLPKDYAAKKAQYLATLRRQRAAQAFDQLLQEARKNLKLVWKDPEARWQYEYARLNDPTAEGDPMKRQQAFIEMMRKYIADNQYDHAAPLILAQILNQEYLMMGLPPMPGSKSPKATQAEREKLRAEIIKYLELGLKWTEDQNSRFMLARTYEEAGQKDKALEQYKTISKYLEYEVPPSNKFAHEQLQSAFRRLNQPELAAKEAKVIAEITTREQKEREEARKRAAEEKKALSQNGKPSSSTATTAPIQPTPKAESKTATPADNSAKPSTSQPVSR